MSSAAGFDTARFGRTLILIGFVTAVFLFLTANRLGPRQFQIGAVAIGAIAMVTAMVGFFIAAGAAFEE